MDIFLQFPQILPFSFKKTKYRKDAANLKDQKWPQTIHENIFDVFISILLIKRYKLRGLFMVLWGWANIFSWNYAEFANNLIKWKGLFKIRLVNLSYHYTSFDKWFASKLKNFSNI